MSSIASGKTMMDTNHTKIVNMNECINNSVIE